jgi:hypothetical protein
LWRAVPTVQGALLCVQLWNWKRGEDPRKGSRAIKIISRNNPVGLYVSRDQVLMTGVITLSAAQWKLIVKLR